MQGEHFINGFNTIMRVGDCFDALYLLKVRSLTNQQAFGLISKPNRGERENAASCDLCHTVPKWVMCVLRKHNAGKRND